MAKSVWSQISSSCRGPANSTAAHDTTTAASSASRMRRPPPSVSGVGPIGGRPGVGRRAEDRLADVASAAHRLPGDPPRRPRAAGRRSPRAARAAASRGRWGWSRTRAAAGLRRARRTGPLKRARPAARRRAARRCGRRPPTAPVGRELRHAVPHVLGTEHRLDHLLHRLEPLRRVLRHRLLDGGRRTARGCRCSRPRRDRCFIRISLGLAPTNGTMPVSISYSSAPSA